MSGGLAATQRWFRLFLLPGVHNCAGGPGADTVDWLTSIRQWVEDGQAPRTITARKLSGGQVTQTRVLQPFPAPPLQ
jgi:feruloyl esterase